jgi:26S proteasome regulatory subunit N2
MPKAFAATCDATPSTFACPEPLKDAKEEVKERVATVVLSTTAKYKKKMKKKQSEKGGEEEEESAAMDVATSAAEDEAAVATAAAADAAAAAEAEPEAESFIVTNPGRVVPAQRALMRLDPSLRWLPISTTTALAGVVVLKDATPDVATTDDDFVEVALSEGGAYSYLSA